MKIKFIKLTGKRKDLKKTTLFEETCTPKTKATYFLIYPF